MHETPREHPIAMRPHSAGNRQMPPPKQIVRDTRASLRAAEVYVRLLLDRLDLACTSDLVQLDGVPADALLRVAAAADTLQCGADRALAHIDRNSATIARMIGATQTW